MKDGLDVNRDRWPEVSRVFSEAAPLDGPSRNAYLDGACRHDPALRAAVESLLGAHDNAGSFGETPVLATVSTVKRLAPGSQLGPFRIESLLGAGGMGEVYRAHDTKLQRAVAIKVLPDSVAQDPNRLARFEEEARALAALNHPNVGAIYGLEESAGVVALVLELIEGPTLAERLVTGPLPFDEVVRIARQLAEGLEAAHERGIVHRDLKPANIKITSDGNVKILDFGLAKTAGSPPSPVLAPSTTSPRHATQVGAVLGTVGYMSPEQALGQAVDKRADNWAFGCVLFEMCAHQPPFAGATISDAQTAVIEREPDWQLLRAGTPANLVRLLRRCLTKDSKLRLRDIGEARIALSPDSVAQDLPVRPAKRRVAAIAAILVLVAVVSMAAGWTLRRASAPPPPWTLTRLTMAAGLSDYPALSPDGRLVAYSSDRAADGRLDLYVKQVAGGQPIPLTTDGAGNTMPDFSPDSTRVVFRSGRDGGGIFEVSAFGGDARLVAPSGLNPKYSPDGSQVAYWVGAPSVAPVVPGSGTVWVARLAGGAPRQVGGHFASARNPVWSPDGSSLLLLGYTSKQADEPSSIDWWLVPLDGGGGTSTGARDLLEREGLSATRTALGARTPLRAEIAAPLCWSRATGSVVFVSALGDASDLWELGISVATGRVSGSVTRLTTSASTEEHAACTPSGNVVFTDLESRDDVWLLAAADLDRRKSSDAPQRITREPADREHASLSKTAQRIAFASNQSGRVNIWIKNLMTGKESIVADSPMLQRFPILDATGTRVAYSSIEPQRRAIHVSTPGGVPQEVCDDCLRATDWSADGQSLLIFRGSPYEITTLDLASKQQTVVFKHPAHHLLYGRYSPDGRWVSFTERIGETQGRIMVAPLDGPRSVPENTWIKIADGEQDDWANWSPDGQTLYFTSNRDGHSCLWGQRIAAGTRRPTGDPFPVLHLHGRVTYKRGGWSSAGGRIAIVLAEETGNVWMMSRPGSVSTSAAKVE